jgi:hypothetical protein
LLISEQIGACAHFYNGFLRRRQNIYLQNKKSSNTPLGDGGNIYGIRRTNNG